MDKKCSKCEQCEKKMRGDDEKKKLINRLNRIAGQVRGLIGMVEQDAYCIDLVNQSSAAAAALNSFSSELLAIHMKTCVTEDIKDGSNYKMDELINTIQKLMK